MKARALAVVALLLLAAPAWGATYWVSPTGTPGASGADSTTNAGTLTWICANFNNSDGIADTIRFKSGDYGSESAIPLKNGTATARVVFLGFPQDPGAVRVNIIRAGNSRGNGTTSNQGDYSTFRWLTAKGGIHGTPWHWRALPYACRSVEIINCRDDGTGSTFYPEGSYCTFDSLNVTMVNGRSIECDDTNTDGIFRPKYNNIRWSTFTADRTSSGEFQFVIMRRAQYFHYYGNTFNFTTSSTSGYMFAFEHYISYQNLYQRNRINLHVIAQPAGATKGVFAVRDSCYGIRLLDNDIRVTGIGEFTLGWANAGSWPGSTHHNYAGFNRMRFVTDGPAGSQGRSGFGIQNGARGDTIEFNLIDVAAGRAFKTSANGFTDCIVRHNTFIGSTFPVVDLGDATSMTGTRLSSNLIYARAQNGSQPLLSLPAAPGIADSVGVLFAPLGTASVAIQYNGVTGTPGSGGNYGVAGKTLWGSPRFLPDSSYLTTAGISQSLNGYAYLNRSPLLQDGFAGAYSDSIGGSVGVATAGVTVTPTDGLFTNEAGTLAPTFSVVLDAAPTASVTIPISTGDATEGTPDKSSLTFTTANWATPQVVTVTGVDDAIVDGDVTYFIVTGSCESADGNYQGLNPADVRVVNRDNDVSCVPSIVISQAGSITSEAGGTATFAVSLSCPPTEDVFLSVSSFDEGEGVITSIVGGDDTFDSGDYATPRTVTITGIDDFLDDGDQPYQVQVRTIAFGGSPYDNMEQRLSFTNTDDDAAGVNVFPVTGLVTSEAGGQATFTVRLTSQPTANVVIGLSSSDLTEGTVSPSSLTFTAANWSSNQTVTVTGVDDAIADGNIAYTIVTAQCVSTDANYAAIDPANVSVSNADNDAAAIVVAPTAGLVTTEAGGQATFTIVLTSQPTASVSIGLTSSDLTEGTVSPASVTFTTGNWATPQTVTVAGQDDGLTDGDIAYTIVTAAASSGDANYNGLNPSDVSVSNTDNEVAAPVATSFTYSVQTTGRNVPINRRVAVVWDSRWGVFGGTTGPGSLNNMDRSLGNFFEMLQLQGCVIHHYSSDWFERTDGNGGNQRNLAIWQTLGSHYGLAIMPYWSASGASSRKTYFSADSTTVPMLHIGGAGNSGYLSWADSSFGLVERAMDAIGSSTFFGLAQGSVRPYAAASTDTMWIVKGGIGTRCAVLPAGVTSVTRLFEPLRLPGAGNVAFSVGLDSLYSTFPAAGNATAGPNEWMPLAWRVNWSSGRSVDYLKMASNSAYGTGNVGPIAIALAARHLDLQPVKFALEWDDITDLNSASGLRPTNAAMDSLYQEFRNVWGIPVTVDVNPRQAASYIAGVTPEYETAVPWSGEGWSWMRRHGVTWVHHAHDSTSAHPSSNLLGRFGGYQPGNGSGDSSGTFGARYKYSHRYASRFNPGNANSSQRWGIVQRLAYSDSVRKAVCPECILPPYLSFPNNEALPMSWRSRPLTANPSWKVYQGDGRTPVDSLMWALHHGLNVPPGTDLYLRATFTTSTGAPAVVLWRPWGDRSTLNMHIGADHDSLPANSPFTFPDERWTGRVRDRFVSARNVATAAYDGGNLANYTGNSGPVLATIFGTRNPVQTGGGIAYLWNESFTLNPSGIYAANNAEMRNIGSRQRTRIVYFHPGSFRHANGPLGSYAADVFRIGILRPIRALESMAGQRLVRWVRPWEVYQP